MKRTFVLGLAALAAFGGLTFSASASCAGPSLYIEGFDEDFHPVRPGDRLTVVGEGFGDFPCDDSGGVGTTGCSGEVSDTEPPASGEPDSGIEVRLLGPVTTRVHRRWVRQARIARTQITRNLGRVDADANGSFELEVAIPDVPPGTYYVHAEGGSPTQIEIR